MKASTEYDYGVGRTRFMDSEDYVGHYLHWLEKNHHIRIYLNNIVNINHSSIGHSYKHDGSTHYLSTDLGAIYQTDQNLASILSVEHSHFFNIFQNKIFYFECKVNLASETINLASYQLSYNFHESKIEIKSRQKTICELTSID